MTTTLPGSRGPSFGRAPWGAPSRLAAARRRPVAGAFAALVALVAAALVAACGAAERPGPELEDPVSTGWPMYRGNYASSAYSPLTQINRDNVHRLQVAWVFRSDVEPQGNRTTLQVNPILANGMLYVMSPEAKVLALHPGTGELIWSYDPGMSGVARGVSYWEEGDDRRVLFLLQRYLFALDADDGTPIESFGEGGRVDLRYGLDRDPDSISVGHAFPGVVFEDRIIVGSNAGSGWRAPPGHIRAYNVRTGELEWTFCTIPHPGEFGYDTWPPDAYQRVGGANNWSGMSLDPHRGLVFVSTAPPTIDYYGGHRRGMNLFGNSVIALDARTGERKWHFQAIHHGIWDWDLPAPPTLVTVERDGERIPAVAQVSKVGFVYVLHRETGEPLFPIEERPVPQSDVPGESTWPTQPIPTKPAPFARQDITEDDLSDISPEVHEYVLNRFRQLRPGPIFTPPSLEGTLIMPGTWGGAEWSGAAFDPETGILYVNANEVPSIQNVVPRATSTEGLSPAEAGRVVFLANGCAGCHGADLSGGDAPALTGLAERRDRATVERTIRQGQGGMPAFTHLGDQEVDALLAYLLEGSTATAGTGGAESDARSVAQLPLEAYDVGGYEKFLDQYGRPGIKPPWGTLTAIDLNTGDHVWQIPLGEYPGVPEEFQPTGTPNFGGAIVTKGGLIFIAATMDEKIRAIDKATGEVLWEHELPAGGYATPATYEFEGKQYVVIAAGGGGKPGTRSGNAYVAFALP